MINNDFYSQIKNITRIIASACLLSMLLSYRLWLGERPFPSTPVFQFLPIFHHPTDWILLSACFLLLLGIIIFRNPQKLIISFIVIAIFISMQDQNRWQPWFYQYLTMFFMLAFFNYRCDDIKKQKSIITTFQLMMAAIYFWSGIQKLNPNFLTDTFPWLMEPITNHLGKESLSYFDFLGRSFPLIETATGLMLLVPFLQKFGLIMSIMMHTFILFVLSPLGHNYNPVVWPWNIAMILFNIILFNKNSSFSLFNFRSGFKYYSSKFVIIFFVFFPLFNFFNYWDSYLSHNLYTGNTSNGVIYISDKIKNKLPIEIQKYAIGEMNQNRINIKYWCMMELGVPAYPEKRNFEAVTKTFYKYTNDSSEIYLMYTPKLKLK